MKKGKASKKTSKKARHHVGGSIKGLRHVGGGKKYKRFGIGLAAGLRAKLARFARDEKISMAGAAVQILTDRLG